MQSLVTLSTDEAEYVGGCLAARAGAFLRNILHEINESTKSPTPLYLDNQSAISLGTNRSSLQQTKHIALRFHYLRELVSSKRFTLLYIPTTIMPAGMFTKAVPAVKMRDAIGLLGMGGCWSSTESTDCYGSG